MFVLDSYCILLKNTYSIMRVKDSTMQSFLVISVKKNLEDVLISYHIIYRVRGTKLSFLLLVRSADPADRMRGHIIKYLERNTAHVCLITMTRHSCNRHPRNTRKPFGTDSIDFVILAA